MGVCVSRNNAVQPSAGGSSDDNIHNYTAVSPKPSSNNSQHAPRPLPALDTQIDFDSTSVGSTDYGHKRHHTLSPSEISDAAGNDGSGTSGVKLHQYKNKICCLIFSVNTYHPAYTTVHYVSLLTRCIQMYMPVLQHYAPLHTHTQLNRFHALYDTCTAGINVALHIIYMTQQYNASLPPHKHQYKIHITGMAVDHGDMVLELPSNKLYGIASDCAAQLSSSTLMTANSVQCSSRVKRELQQSDADLLDACNCVRREPQPGKKLHDALQAHFYSISITDKYPVEYATIASVSDDQYIHHNLLPLTARHDPQLSDGEISVTDKALTDQFYTANHTFILRYALHIEHVTQLSGSLASHEINTNISVTYNRIIELHNGLSVDNTFAIFGNAPDAVLCAMAMQRALQHYNRQATPADTVGAVGFALDSSHLIVIPETDVCQGSAVFTADQLLQDAKGAVVISEAVYSSVHDQLAQQYVFTMQPVASNNLKTYAVNVPERSTDENGVVNIRPMS